MTDSAKFLEWFTTNGGEFSKDIVAIGENVDGMGRGLVAVADIKVGVLLTKHTCIDTFIGRN